MFSGKSGTSGWSSFWYCPECGGNKGLIDESDIISIYKCENIDCYWSGPSYELITTEEGRINLRRFQTLKDILLDG